MQENSNPQLPIDIANLETDQGNLSPRVAVSEALKDYENRMVVFSFEPYNSNQCRIGSIDKKEAKKLTRELKVISRTLAKHFRHQSTSGIACKRIHNSGNYSVLFDGVPEDTEMLEIDYSGPGRIFGFMVNNVFNIVAIGKEHR